MPKPRPSLATLAGLAAGAIGIIVASFVLPDVAALPFGLLALDAALAWGLVSFARALFDHDAPWDALVAALAPYLVVGFLARRVAYASGILPPVPMRASLLLEMAILAAALLAFAVIRRRAGDRVALAATGAAGVIMLGALLARLAALPPAPAPGDVAILGIAVASAAGLLVTQVGIARHLGGKLAVLGTPIALAVAASQLLDGTITYLSVVDPFGLASGDYREQIALSAFALDVTGPGYVALKWAVAVAAGYAIGRDAASARKAERRFGLALLLVYLGLQPAIFSGSQLL